MAFLTIGPYAVDVQEVAQDQNDLVGSMERAWAGNWLGDVRARKGVWAFLSVPVDVTLFAGLRGMDRTLQPCTGDVFGGVTFTCLVEIGRAEALEDHAAGRALRWIVPIVLRQD